MLSRRVKAAVSPEDLLAKDIEQPQKPIIIATPESPQKAAEGLQKYLQEGGKFGTVNFPSKAVAAAQRVLMVADDGIVGPQTRAACRKYGVLLPSRQGQTQAPAPAETVSTGARETGATEPEPVQVAQVPAQQKGSIVVRARVKLGPLEAMVASPAAIKSRMTPHIGRVGPLLARCPGAPQLKGSPSIIPLKKDDEYQITIRWAALWPSEGLSPALKSCIARKAYAITEIKERLVPGSLSITRS